MDKEIIAHCDVPIMIDPKIPLNETQPFERNADFLSRNQNYMKIKVNVYL